MNRRLPIRHPSHSLEDESIRFLESYLPREWICRREKRDYGIDLRVSIVVDGQVTGVEFIVQMKSSTSQSLPADGNERVRLAVSTYNYLASHLHSAAIIKYVSSENEAYWEFVRHIDSPRRQSQREITVRIPRANRVSQADWHDWLRHMQEVHDKKLGRNRR